MIVWPLQPYVATRLEQLRKTSLNFYLTLQLRLETCQS